MKENNEYLDKEKAKVYLLYLLKKLHEITEREGIPIYASGGTCLGMIRHQGMIPWDDDIDIMIFRKDYKRFVQACEKSLSLPIVLRTRDNDPFFYEEFAKLCFLDDDNNYTSLSIDVFELDETNPKRHLFREFQNQVKRGLYYTKMYKVSKLGYGKYHPKSIFKRCILSIGSLLSIRSMDRLLIKILTAEKKEGDYVVNWGAAYSYKKATYPRKAFGTPHKMPFENMYVWSEEYPEMILECLYGKDYMKLPPIEKRTDHGVKSFKCSKLDFDAIKKEVYS